MTSDMCMPVGTAIQGGNRKAKTSDMGTRLACTMAKMPVSLETLEQEGELWELQMERWPGQTRELGMSTCRGVPTRYDIG